MFIDLNIFTVHNEVAKVMFLQASVCPHAGGVCLSACWDTTPPPPGADIPQEQTTPRTDTPPGRRPLLRTVRILLECIFVTFYI